MEENIKIITTEAFHILGSLSYLTYRTHIMWGFYSNVFLTHNSGEKAYIQKSLLRGQKTI